METAYLILRDTGFIMKYKIKSGDTLGKISKETGIPLSEIVALNNIKDPNKIYAGQDLILGVPPLPDNKPKSEENNILKPHQALYLRGMAGYQKAKLGAPPAVFTEKDTDIFPSSVTSAIDKTAEYFYGDNSKENQNAFLKNIKNEKQRKEYQKILNNNQIDYGMVDNVLQSKSIFEDNYNISTPAAFIKTTLGQFSVSKDDKDNWRVKDRYDFEKKDTLFDSLGRSFDQGSIYPIARYLGGVAMPEKPGGGSTEYAPYIDLTIPRSVKMASNQTSKKKV